ncbi:hypothetical protein GCM10010522_01960 [Kribbella solani]
MEKNEQPATADADRVRPETRRNVRRLRGSDTVATSHADGVRQLALFADGVRQSVLPADGVRRSVLFPGQ